MSKKVCKVENCNKSVHGHGYCSKHYYHFKKWGDPLKGNFGQSRPGEMNGMYGTNRTGEENPFYGHKHTKEAKKKMGLANKGNRVWLGRKHSEEFKEKMSKSKKGMTLGSEWKQKISDALKGRKITYQHRIKISDAHKELVREGNHHAGDGSITEEDVQFRQSVNYKIWRDKVVSRDNHSCQECGSVNNLHAHHIEPFVDYKELRLDLDNGKTLCKECHLEVHSYVEKEV